MKQTFILFLSVLLFTACTKDLSKDFWMDNPTEAPISVIIDDKTYDIPSNSGVKVNLSPGKHQLTYNNESVAFVVKPNDQDVVLNPTLGNYIFYHEMYVVQGKAENEDRANELTKSYLYDFESEPGVIVKVPFKVVNSLFIERYKYYWHFAVTEPMKDNITINYDGPMGSNLVRSKLFRQNEFLDYIGKDNLPEKFVFTPSNEKLSTLEPFVLVPDSMLSCPCEPANALYKKMKDKFESLSTITDPVEFEKVYYDISVTIPYREFSNELQSECEKVDKEYISRSLAVGKKGNELGEMNAYVVKL